MTDIDVKPPRGRIAHAFAHPALRIAVPVVVVSIALVVLYRIASHIPLEEVRADLASASGRSLGLAMAATLGSFAALALYDVLAVRIVVPGRVPSRVAALAGACGYAVSNLLGLSWLTGSAVRYRIYSALGLDAGRVAAVIALNWSAFWMGGILIVGLLLVFHPVGLSAILPLTPTVETSIGLSLLLGLAAFLIWLARGARRLSLFGATFTLPDISNVALMAAVAVVDLLATSLVLYVLLPADLAQNFAAYFIVFFMAVALGQLSHAPGGLGVFEASIVVGLAAGGRSDVLAALVLYRLIYTVLPFAFATLGLGISEAIRGRRAIGRAARWTHVVVRAIAAPVAAGIALLSGTILLFSGNLPGEPGRLRILRDIIPLPLIEVSHLAASIVGLLLIVIARGL